MFRTSLLILSLLTLPLPAQRNNPERAAWNQPIAPLQIIGNVYYVGAKGVSSFLIKTSQGLILLDGGLAETAPLIEKNVATLGFRMKDVRYLLNSHAHYDHCGGLAELKTKSGAQMIASGPDSTLHAGKRHLNCSDPIHKLPAIAVDRVIADQEHVQLGDTTLIAHLTPGHTIGCTTWSMKTNEGAKSYNVVFSCGTSVAGNQLVHNKQYPQIVSDYVQSFAKLRNMPCDVFLTGHGMMFDLETKAALVQQGHKDAFVDPTALRKHVDEAEETFKNELAEQRVGGTR